MGIIKTYSMLEAISAFLGLWFIFRGAPDFASSVFTYATQREHIPAEMLKLYTLHFVTNVCIGFSLLLFRKKLARWLSPKDNSGHLQPEAFVGIGVAILGAYFIGSGIISLGESYAVKLYPNTSNPYLFWRGCFSLGTGITFFVFSVGAGRIWKILKGLKHVGV